MDQREKAARPPLCPLKKSPVPITTIPWTAIGGEGGGALPAAGVALGPQLAAFVSVAPHVDLLLSAEVELSYPKTTNGADSARDVSVVGLSLPFNVGARGRW